MEISTKLISLIKYMIAIPENKMDLFLKLGKILVQFVKTDFYFESRTFDWIKLQKENDLYKATFIRTIDEGDDLFTDVLTFETVNEIDEFENKMVTGSKEEVYNWIKTELNMPLNNFYKTDYLNIKYLELVNQNILGSQLDD